MLARKTSGFTLVEIMVVVVIIGLLAAMALPAFDRARERSQNLRLANDLRVFVGAIETYLLETGLFPEDSNSGAIPAGMGPYIKSDQWNKGPSIGGLFDVEYEDSSVTLAIGVVDYTIPDTQLEKFDEQFDDGNITTGRFRIIAAGRYYYVIED